MATTYTHGVYDSTQTKTVNSSLSLSGSNVEVVLLTSGNVTNLLTFGVLYIDQDATEYSPVPITITLDRDGTDTTFTTLLSSDGTQFTIVDVNGLTSTYTLTAGETTLFA
ncbi:MAG: hypothetical protein OEV22_10825, partial [Deltaproteobacteria bacterium]|nr:hypothetical protein [Deltaproteobacteria bacterium]